MNIIDFLYDNYLWIIAILVIAIFTMIGFIADRKSKSKSGKGNESIGTPNNQAKVVPTEVPTPTNNINTNMNMTDVPNNNYQNINNNMINNDHNLTTNMPPINNMNEQGMVNNYTNGGVVNPMNQVPNMGMNENMMSNSNQTMNGVGQNIPNFNVAPTPEPSFNQVNQMMPNDNMPQGFNNAMPTNNQNVNQVNNGTLNVNPMAGQAPVYNNQAYVNENPSMVVNSWDEPKPVNPVSINQGFNQNVVGNIPTNNSSSQIPIQESIPVNAVPNNMPQQTTNNIPNANGVPGLNFMYGSSQNNNNNLQ